MKKFFEMLGAPLANHLWSWGAERSDGTIFLRQWTTDVHVEGGRRYVVIAHNSDSPAGPRQHGWRERRRHIESIRCGAPCFIVMIEPIDPNASPKFIRTFDAYSILSGGEMSTQDGVTRLRVINELPLSAFVK